MKWKWKEYCIVSGSHGINMMTTLSSDKAPVILMSAGHHLLLHSQKKQTGEPLD